MPLADLAWPLWAVACVAAVVMLLSKGRLARLGSLIVLAASVALALVVIARRAEWMPPTGDVGVIEVYVFNALRGTQLLGPYSRFLWHHPGPIYFYLLAPFYVLSGYRTTGVAAGALAINLTSIALVAWTARHAGSRRTAIALSGACLLYAWRFGRLLTSQWNPHVPVFPFMAFVVVAAAAAAGHLWFVPVLFVLGTFAVQTHLGLAPAVAVVGACALAGALITTKRTSPDEEGRNARARQFWWLLNAGLWMSAALWFLPIVEEAAHSPGNMTMLWRFFAGGRAGGQGLGTAFSAWAGAFPGVLRTGFAMAWGAKMSAEFSLWSAVAACATLAALIAAAIALGRRGQRFQAALATLIVAAAIVACWAVTRIAGDIVDHEVFWMSGLGVLAVGVLVDAAVELVERRYSHRVSWARLSGCATDAIALVILAAIVGLGAVDLYRRVDEASRPGDEELAAASLSEGIVNYARREGSPKLLIDIEGRAWQVAAGTIVELERAGVSFAVVPNALWMFGESSRPDGSETRRILISGYSGHDGVVGKAGTVPLAGRRGFFADLVAAP